MDPKQFLTLLNKYRDNTLTPEESLQLENWYNEMDAGADQLTDIETRTDKLSEDMLLDFRKRLVKPSVHTIPVRRLNVFRKLSRIAAILAGVSILVAGGLLFFHKPKQPVAVSNATSPSQIAAPTSNKAILTLGDGSQIAIDSASNGTIALEGKISIIKQADGQIAYMGLAAGTVQYNTLSLPKGSRPMKLMLADGSLVWLNTASSITYPTSFTGSERKVSIQGEAYFEVAKNAGMPFHVQYDDADITVLGTHFNVNSYADEIDSRVTLLEGSVKVATSRHSDILRPGQQAQIASQAITIDKQADLEEVMAWKNGRFYFDGTDIKTIMRQVEKWYNVEVYFQSEISDSFVAKISRNENLSELLKILQLTNLVHFKIEGNKIIIMK